jgi:arginase
MATATCPRWWQWNQRVFDAVFAELQQGHLPILLGGDHCLGLGSISAVARHCARGGQKAARAVAGCPCRLQHQRAHAQRQCARHARGLPVRLWPHELGWPACPAGAPALHPDQIRQIGIRSVDAGEKRFVHEGLEVFDMRYIDEVGMRQTMQQALAGLDDDTHLHVSFDVDFLDPDIAPGVGTTVPGGPTYREAQLCMEMIADSGAGLARHRGGTQPGARCAQPDGAAGGGPGGIAVWQKHADAPSTEPPPQHGTPIA